MPLRRSTPFEIGLATMLAMLAGAVDAIGFRQIGGLFVSFMSGNTTRLGIFLSTGQAIQAATAIGIIVAFVAGAAVGSSLGFLVAPQGRRQAVLLIEAALVLGAAAFATFGPRETGLVPLAMAMAMGVENAVFANEDGETTVNLTFMTGALVKVGEGIARQMFGGPRWSWWPYLLLWFSLAAGALLGSMSYGAFGVRSLWSIGAVLLVIAICVGHCQQTKQHP